MTDSVRSEFKESRLGSPKGDFAVSLEFNPTRRHHVAPSSMVAILVSWINFQQGLPPVSRALRARTCCLTRSCYKTGNNFPGRIGWLELTLKNSHFSYIFKEK